MDDEAERAQEALALLARERPVPAAQAPPTADRVAEQQRELARDGRRARRAAREVERRLERLDLAAERVGQDAMDLRERALDRVLGARQPEAARGDRPERDDDRLLVGEHQRRDPVAGADPVPAAHAALALDGNPELLKPRHVATNGARVDL